MKNLNDSDTKNTGFVGRMAGNQPEDSDIRIADIPDRLGGGQYKTAGPGTLIKTPRGYAGIEAKPGTWREHLQPVSLGGTSNLPNIEVRKTSEGKYKTQEELKIINDYKSGKLDLPEARLAILKLEREIQGLDPKQGTMNYLLPTLAEPLEIFGKMLTQTLSKPVPQKPDKVKKLVTSEEEAQLSYLSDEPVFRAAIGEGMHPTNAQILSLGMGPIRPDILTEKGKQEALFGDEFKVQESKIKDIWDKTRLSYASLYQNGKDYFLSALPNLIFQEAKIKDPKTIGMADFYTKPTYFQFEADFYNQFNLKAREFFADKYEKSQERFQQWLKENPQLQDREEWSGSVIDRVKENPMILGDPAYLGYLAAETIPFTTTVMGTTAIVTLATKNAGLGLMAGLAVATPVVSQDLYEDLVNEGATEEQAAQLTGVMGPAISAVEVVSDIPILQMLGIRFFTKQIQKEAVKQVVKLSVGQLIKRGAINFAKIEAIETIEELIQQALQNATVKVVNKSRGIFEGLDETAIRTLLSTLPLAFLGIGGSKTDQKAQQIQQTQQANQKSDLTTKLPPPPPSPPGTSSQITESEKMTAYRGEGSAFDEKIGTIAAGMPGNKYALGEGFYVSTDKGTAERFGTVKSYDINLKDSEIMKINTTQELDDLITNALKKFPEFKMNTDKAIPAYAKSLGYKAIQGNYDINAGMNIIDESVINKKPTLKPAVSTLEQEAKPEIQIEKPKTPKEKKEEEDVSETVQKKMNEWNWQANPVAKEEAMRLVIENPEIGEKSLEKLPKKIREFSDKRHFNIYRASSGKESTYFNSWTLDKNVAKSFLKEGEDATNLIIDSITKKDIGYYYGGMGPGMIEEFELIPKFEFPSYVTDDSIDLLTHFRKTEARVIELEQNIQKIDDIEKELGYGNLSNAAKDLYEQYQDELKDLSADLKQLDILIDKKEEAKIVKEVQGPIKPSKKETVKVKIQEKKKAKSKQKVTKPTIKTVEKELPAGTKESKIAKSIEAKAIEAKLTEGFKGITGYTPITIEEQAKLASEVMKDMDRAKRIIAGKEALPSGLKGAALITAMENYAMETRNGQLALDIANSPLITETSEAGQTLRLTRERVQDSAAKHIADIKKLREKQLENQLKRTKKKSKVARNIIKGQIKNAKENVSVTKSEWDSFLEEIRC